MEKAFKKQQLLFSLAEQQPYANSSCSMLNATGLLALSTCQDRQESYSLLTPAQPLDIIRIHTKVHSEAAYCHTLDCAPLSIPISTPHKQYRSTASHRVDSSLKTRSFTSCTLTFPHLRVSLSSLAGHPDGNPPKTVSLSRMICSLLSNAACIALSSFSSNYS